MAEYLNSAKIKVYPSGYRSAKIDLEASRTTEGSVTKALKAPIYSINDNYCFVKQEDDNSITLVLDGYVFNIKDAFTELPSLFSDNTITQIYAYLNVANIATLVDDTSASMRMLVNESGESSVDDETSGKFEGIGFTPTQPSASTHPVQILVLERGQLEGGGYSSWRIPFKSRLNLTTSQIANYDNKPISQYLDVEREFSIGNLLIKGDYSDAPYDEGTTISTFKFGTSSNETNNEFTVDASNDSYINLINSALNYKSSLNATSFRLSNKINSSDSDFSNYTSVFSNGIDIMGKSSDNASQNASTFRKGNIILNNEQTSKSIQLDTNNENWNTLVYINKYNSTSNRTDTTKIGSNFIGFYDKDAGGVENQYAYLNKTSLTFASGYTNYIDLNGGKLYAKQSSYTPTYSTIDFVGTSTKAKDAQNVKTYINGKAITSIFESDGVTAKKATGDSDGNTIKTNYGHSLGRGTHTISLNNMNGTTLNTVNNIADLITSPDTTHLLASDSIGQPIMSKVGFSTITLNSTECGVVDYAKYTPLTSPNMLKHTEFRITRTTPETHVDVTSLFAYSSSEIWPLNHKMHFYLTNTYQHYNDSGVEDWEGYSSSDLGLLGFDSNSNSPVQVHSEMITHRSEIRCTTNLHGISLKEFRFRFYTDSTDGKIYMDIELADLSDLAPGYNNHLILNCDYLD